MPWSGIPQTEPRLGDGVTVLSFEISDTMKLGSSLALYLLAAMLFIGGCVAFIYGTTDAGLSLLQFTQAGAWPQVGLACWLAAVVCVAIGIGRLLRSREPRP